MFRLCIECEILYEMFDFTNIELTYNRRNIQRPITQCEKKDFE